MNGVATNVADPKTNRSNNLITRSEMLVIAKEYNLFITKSTIHRWANEPGFPVAQGMQGRCLLYSQSKILNFLKNRIERLQEDR